MGTVGTVIARVLLSKKVHLAFGPLIAALLGTEATGIEGGLQTVVLTATAALSSVLSAIQGALDFRHGSRSDGTGGFVKE